MTALRGGVAEIYLRLRREDIAYLKFVVESYEGIGVVRTIDRRQAVVVVLVAPDFLPLAREVLAAIQAEIGWEEVTAPSGAGEDDLLEGLPEEPPDHQ